ncbi:hypothetical protein BS78_03G248100 [Paspalum vaginatum]|nr:hypothetical protein BS78_03G248100 [Paspalum vaginatum]
MNSAGGVIGCHKLEAVGEEDAVTPALEADQPLQHSALPPAARVARRSDPSELAALGGGGSGEGAAEAATATVPGSEHATYTATLRRAARKARKAQRSAEGLATAERSRSGLERRKAAARERRRPGRPRWAGPAAPWRFGRGRRLVGFVSTSTKLPMEK